MGLSNGLWTESEHLAGGQDPETGSVRMTEFSAAFLGRVSEQKAGALDPPDRRRERPIGQIGERLHREPDHRATRCIAAMY